MIWLQFILCMALIGFVSFNLLPGGTTSALELYSPIIVSG